MLQDGGGIGDLESVLRLLASRIGDLAVVEDDGETTGAALVVSPANALGELGLGVRQEELDCESVDETDKKEKKTYNVITGDLVGLAPGAHDIGIVVGKDGNNVDTLGTELGKLLNVLGNVTGRADGGEGTGESEEDDLLVGPLLGGVVVDGDTAGGDVSLVLGPGDVAKMVVRFEVAVWGEKRGRLTRRQRQRGSCHQR